MAFLLPLVYLGAVAYISVEISLGLFWRRDILRGKGQALFTYRKFLSNRIGASKRDIWTRAGNVIAPSLNY